MNSRQKFDFATAGRLTLAINYARELAEREPGTSAAVCAERAVRRVFGRWLLEPTAALRPATLPLFFQLIAKVESRMGVHRAPRRTWRSPPPGGLRLAMSLPQADALPDAMRPAA